MIEFLLGLVTVVGPLAILLLTYPVLWLIEGIRYGVWSWTSPLHDHRPPTAATAAKEKARRERDWGLQEFAREMALREERRLHPERPLQRAVELNKGTKTAIAWDEGRNIQRKPPQQGFQDRKNDRNVRVFRRIKVTA